MLLLTRTTLRLSSHILLLFIGYLLANGFQGQHSGYQMFRNEEFPWLGDCLKCRMLACCRDEGEKKLSCTDTECEDICLVQNIIFAYLYICSSHRMPVDEFERKTNLQRKENLYISLNIKEPKLFYSSNISFFKIFYSPLKIVMKNKVPFPLVKKEFLKMSHFHLEKSTNMQSLREIKEIILIFPANVKLLPKVCRKCHYLYLYKNPKSVYSDKSYLQLKYFKLKDLFYLNETNIVFTKCHLFPVSITVNTKFVKMLEKCLECSKVKCKKSTKENERSLKYFHRNRCLYKLSRNNFKCKKFSNKFDLTAETAGMQSHDVANMNIRTKRNDLLKKWLTSHSKNNVNTKKETHRLPVVAAFFNRNVSQFPFRERRQVESSLKKRQAVFNPIGNTKIKYFESNSTKHPKPFPGAAQLKKSKILTVPSAHIYFTGNVTTDDLLKNFESFKNTSIMITDDLVENLNTHSNPLLNNSNSVLNFESKIVKKASSKNQDSVKEKIFKELLRYTASANESLEKNNDYRFPKYLSGILERGERSSDTSLSLYETKSVTESNVDFQTSKHIETDTQSEIPLTVYPWSKVLSSLFSAKLEIKTDKSESDQTDVPNLDVNFNEEYQTKDLINSVSSSSYSDFNTKEVDQTKYVTDYFFKTSEKRNILKTEEVELNVKAVEKTKDIYSSDISVTSKLLYEEFQPNNMDGEFSSIKNIKSINTENEEAFSLHHEVLTDREDSVALNTSPDIVQEGNRFKTENGILYTRTERDISNENIPEYNKRMDSAPSVGGGFSFPKLSTDSTKDSSFELREIKNGLTTIFNKNLYATVKGLYSTITVQDEARDQTDNVFYPQESESFTTKNNFSFRISVTPSQLTTNDQTTNEVDEVITDLTDTDLYSTSYVNENELENVPFTANDIKPFITEDTVLPENRITENTEKTNLLLTNFYSPTYSDGDALNEEKSILTPNQISTDGISSVTYLSESRDSVNASEFYDKKSAENEMDEYLKGGDIEASISESDVFSLPEESIKSDDYTTDADELFTDSEATADYYAENEKDIHLPGTENDTTFGSSEGKYHSESQEVDKVNTDVNMNEEITDLPYAFTTENIFSINRELKNYLNNTLSTYDVIIPESSTIFNTDYSINDVIVTENITISTYQSPLESSSNSLNGNKFSKDKFSTINEYTSAQNTESFDYLNKDFSVDPDVKITLSTATKEVSDSVFYKTGINIDDKFYSSTKEAPLPEKEETKSSYDDLLSTSDTEPSLITSSDSLTKSIDESTNSLEGEIFTNGASFSVNDDNLMDDSASKSMPTEEILIEDISSTSITESSLIVEVSESTVGESFSHSEISSSSVKESSPLTEVISLSTGEYFASTEISPISKSVTSTSNAMTSSSISEASAQTEVPLSKGIETKYSTHTETPSSSVSDFFQLTEFTPLIKTGSSPSNEFFSSSVRESSTSTELSSLGVNELFNLTEVSSSSLSASSTSTEVPSLKESSTETTVLSSSLGEPSTSSEVSSTIISEYSTFTEVPSLNASEHSSSDAIYDVLNEESTNYQEDYSSPSEFYVLTQDIETNSILNRNLVSSDIYFPSTSDENISRPDDKTTPLKSEEATDLKELSSDESGTFPSSSEDNFDEEILIRTDRAVSSSSEEHSFVPINTFSIGSEDSDQEDETPSTENEIIRTEREIIPSNEESISIEGGVEGSIDMSLTKNPPNVPDISTEIINPDLSPNDGLDFKVNSITPGVSYMDPTTTISFDETTESNVNFNLDISTEFQFKTSQKDLSEETISNDGSDISLTEDVSEKTSAESTNPLASSTLATTPLDIKPRTEIITTTSEEDIKVFPELSLAPMVPDNPTEDGTSESSDATSSTQKTTMSQTSESFSHSSKNVKEFSSTIPIKQNLKSITPISTTTKQISQSEKVTSSSRTQDKSTASPTESIIIPFHFTIDADYDEVVSTRKEEFEKKLGKQLVIAMRVPFECLQNLRVSKGSIDVNFELVPSSEHGHMADEKALRAAADELKRMIDNGQLAISDLDGNTLVVVPMDPPTTPPPVTQSEHTTLILGVVIGAFIITVLSIAIAAIIIKRKANGGKRMTPIEEVRSKLPSYREIPFQEALFMKAASRNKISLGKYCYNTGQWLGPGPEPIAFQPPDSVVYRPPTDSEIRRTPRPPTAVRERLKSDWELDWDSMVSSR